MFYTQAAGEYSFCFENPDTQATKELNFNIVVDGKEVADDQHLPTHPHKDEQDNSTISRLDQGMANFTTFIDHIALERHRNFYQGESLLASLSGWALIRMWYNFPPLSLHPFMLIRFTVIFSVLQLTMIKRLFDVPKRSRKSRFRV